MDNPVGGDRCVCGGLFGPRTPEEADRNGVIAFSGILVGLVGGIISQVIPCVPCAPFTACALCSTTYGGLNRLFDAVRRPEQE